MKEMLCIDFGNSFTKVAVRKTADSPSSLLTDTGVTTDSLNACVPTVAGQFSDGRWFYGLELEMFNQDVEGMTVYRNWKPQFFQMPNIELMPGIAGVVPATPRRRGRPPKSLKSASGLDYHMIGVGYFRWLRNFWDGACRKVTGQPCSEIPVRVTLPSFGAQSGAELKLKNILMEAGWLFDNAFPVLPEPLANVIGALSNGANKQNPRGTDADYGQMFRETGLFQRMRKLYEHGGSPVAWTLIVDVGGFTTDFAMLGIDLELLSANLDREVEGKPGLKHKSIPLGIADLDRRVLEALPESKKPHFERLGARVSSSFLDGFHVNVYGKPVTRQKLSGGPVIGETESERRAIRDVIAVFAGQVANGAEDFLSQHNHDRIDDVILTGGGTMIHEVSNTLSKRLKHYKYEVAHCHIPTGEEAKPPFRRLSKQLPRGGTAIGGTSLYFDFATNE